MMDAPHHPVSGRSHAIAQMKLGQRVAAEQLKNIHEQLATFTPEKVGDLAKVQLAIDQLQETVRFMTVASRDLQKEVM